MAIQPGISREYIGQKHVLWTIIIFTAVVCAALQFVVKPIFIIAGIALIPALLYTLTRPYLGILIYYFVMILRPAELAPALMAIGMERLMAALVIVSFTIESLVRRQTVHFVNHPVLWLIIVFFGVQVISGITSLETTLTFTKAIKYLNYVIFVVLLAHIVTTPSRFRGVIWMHIVMMGYIAISALIAYATGNVFVAQGITRIKSLTSAAGDPNSLAASMAITVPFVALLLKVEKKRALRIFLVVLGVSMLYAIIVSGSRGGLLTLITAAFGLWLTSRRKAMFAGIGAMAVGILILVMPQQYLDRYYTIAEYAEGSEVDASTQGRLDAWKAGLHMFVDHPIIGVGAHAFGWAHGHYYSPGFTRSSLQAHNMYIQLIAELGIVGVLSFGGLLWSIFHFSRRLKEYFSSLGESGAWPLAVVQALRISAASLLVYAITGHSLYRFHWIFCGVLVVIMAQLVQRGYFLKEAEGGAHAQPS